jgi:hypothetical protein
MPAFGKGWLVGGCARAKQLAKALEKKRCSVWWNRRIRAGESIDRVNEEAIRAARRVVVLWSNESVDSEWVRAVADVG